MHFGYARVSTDDQNLSLQLDALKTAGCEKIFREKVSGAKTDRPELTKLIDQIREGDTLTVWKLDRLGRSLKHLVETVNLLHEKGVGFRSLKESIDTTSATGKLTFHIFAAMAEFERDMLRERTNAGLQAARSRGRVGGRRPGISSELLKKAPTARVLYEAKTLGVDEIARQLGIGKPTLYKLLRHEGVQISPYKKQS
ncbi:recombinase family protein [Arsenicibacter rosenii]|uniref:Resolvase n=1 Tax=Arsenicibacter rosenii TaxID=1750698 RepID=A0A1S2VS92_9BACT|nr:recombinase family protein [Arsenicibacter rosenii]OIN61205.1 resolvase [Arsenicibacter rosenii]